MLHHNIDALVDAIHYTSASRPIIIGVKPRSFCFWFKTNKASCTDTNFYKAHHALWVLMFVDFQLIFQNMPNPVFLIALVDIQFYSFHIAYLRPPYCIIYFRKSSKPFKIAFYKPEPPTNIT
jgi:hypothetical protein